MCYTEEDDELWQEDPYEFIRVKYGKEQNIRGSPGLEVNFLIHLQSFASKIFSIGKPVRPLANSFQMFGRSA